MTNSVLSVCNVDEEGRFGGPERRIIQVAQELKKYNVETHVVYPNFDSDKFTKELSNAEISSFSLSITRLSKERKILIRYLMYFPIEIYRLYSFFKNKKFDLIHVNGSYQFKVALAAKLSGIPVVWHLNDTMMPSVVKNIFTIVSRFCADGFIVAGKRVQDYYIQGYKDLEKIPSIEIHAPVNTAIFDPEQVLKNTSTNTSKGIKIVTVSGVNPTKGLEYFIRMASLLLQHNRNIVFYVAGAELQSHQHYYEELKKLIASLGITSNNLHFVGMVDDVPAFLQSADICVFTSISEASPTSIWEAMSMGKAIVTTDVGSVNQHIDNGVSGFVVPIKDVNALSDQVDILLNDPALRLEMGRAARWVAENNLDISVAAEKHFSFYREIIAR